MFRSRYLLPIFNFSLFSGLLVCQLVIDSSFNFWMLGICAIGAVVNLYCFFVVSRDEPVEGPRKSDLRSDDKSAIMSDLDQEIVRRREIEKVEKN